MARTAMDLRLDRHVTRVRYGKVAPIIVAYPDNSDDYVVGHCNMLLSVKFLRVDRRALKDSTHSISNFIDSFYFYIKFEWKIYCDNASLFNYNVTIM